MMSRPDDRVEQSCRGFCSVPGPLQSVQRAELWGGYSCSAGVCAFILGITLTWSRHVSRLSDGVRHLCPAELLKDGDLILLIDRILQQRGRDTVRVTKG